MNSTFAMSAGGNVLPKLESASSTTSGNHAKPVPDYKVETPPEKQRGRAQGRGIGKYKNEFENKSRGEGTGVENLSSADEGGPSRKRRRSRKGLERKFECPAEGCGKVYSRAEHLNRHKLNHSATTIYPCTQENCPRTFVRLDLCTRHIQRHESKGKGSQLGRKDSVMYNPSPSITGSKPKVSRRSASPEFIKTENKSAPQDDLISPQTSSDTFSPPTTAFSEVSNTTSNWFPHSNEDQRQEFSPRISYPGPGNNGLNANFSGHERHASLNNLPPTSDGVFMPSPSRSEVVRYGLDGMQTLSQASPLINHSLNYGASATVAPGMQHDHPPRTMGNIFAQHEYNQNQASYMITSAHAHPPQPQPFGGSYSIPTPAQSVPEGFQPQSTSNEQQLWSPEFGAVEQMQQQYMPMLFAGGEAGYDRSPNAGSADCLIDLILVGGDNSLSLDGSTTQPLGTYSDIPAQFQHQWEAESGQHGFPRSTMDVNTILQHKPREHRISELKAQELFKMIKERFNESEESAITPLKSRLMDGDRGQEAHMLSTKRMQEYIDLYFDQFHPQIPILHQPTFIPDNTPNLLLLAIMAIGASCLDRKQNYEVSEKAAALSNFLAWHIRSEAMNHKEFRPPSSLWMFQTLLLLELYEKMYSDRMLHERAHIHHVTTITLMRRGCSLTGTASNHSPRRKETKDRPYASPVTDDPWWNQFIEAESIHRAAYVAFLIDITHAVMFGHSSSMYVTELKLSLPCNDAIWAAPTCSEAKRLYGQHLRQMGKGKAQTSFLDGIWKIWEGKELKTDTFGRTVLMAGLLFCLWHVKQREQQNESLKEIGARPKWKWEEWNEQLSRAFDTWSHEFDKSLSSIFSGPYRHREELICESRSVLHHLANMAMHIDVIECQIYAGASKLLGRAILPNDYNWVANKWKKKIHLKGTQRAVFYALQFLHSVLLPNPRTASSQAYDEYRQYRARDDPLLNRPWVLYYAALAVWCFGYAKEGEQQPVQQGLISVDYQKPSNEKTEMEDFLKKFYLPNEFKVNPGYLAEMKGWNQNTGLLMVVRSCFDDCRWELLKEAQKLLTNCMRQNSGKKLSC